MTTIRKATERDIRILSKKLLTLLEDKNSQAYQENVAKFGIPDKYVKEAFAEQTLLKAVKTQKATFYQAFEDNEIIGFAQTIQRDANTTELDRIIIFPQHARKGIGTQVLQTTLKDQKQRGIHTIIVNTAKEETHARRF